MIYFQPASLVASCKTLDGALQLCRFMKQWVTKSALCGPALTFRAMIETDGKVSVHSSSPVDEAVMSVFKQAIAEFKTAYVAGAA
jgi:hypothetical protein